MGSHHWMQQLEASNGIASLRHDVVVRVIITNNNDLTSINITFGYTIINNTDNVDHLGNIVAIYIYDISIKTDYTVVIKEFSP